MEIKDGRIEVVSGWRIRVELGWVGLTEMNPQAFDPDELTTLTGISPTRTWRRGDPNQLGAPVSTCGWKIVSEAPSNADLADHIASLMAMLKGHEDGFREAASRNPAGLDFVIYTDFETPSPWMQIPMAPLAELAALGAASLWVDVGV